MFTVYNHYKLYILSIYTFSIPVCVFSVMIYIYIFLFTVYCRIILFYTIYYRYIVYRMRYTIMYI